MAKIGWFNESIRHSLASKGIKTSFNYQDSDRPDYKYHYYSVRGSLEMEDGGNSTKSYQFSAWPFKDEKDAKSWISNKEEIYPIVDVDEISEEWSNDKKDIAKHHFRKWRD